MAIGVQAVVCRRSLLSRCLLTVPQQTDFLENGILQSDDRYRSPWIKTRPDGEFLSAEAESATIVVDDLIQHIESFTHGPEAYSNEPYIDCDADVVPSSNPNSPDTYVDHMTVCAATPDVLTDSYEKEDLMQYCPISDEYRIEVISEEDYLKEKINTLPSVSTLKERLRPMQVRDPLAGGNENFDRDLRFSEEETVLMLDGQYDIELFKETFDNHVCHQMVKGIYGGLETVVTPPCSQPKEKETDEIAKLMSTVVGTKEALPLETETDVEKVVQSQLCPQYDCLKHESLWSSPVLPSKPSFVDVNKIVITEDDKFYDKATLDEPVDDLVERSLSCPRLQLPALEKIPVAEPATDIRLLNEKEKKVLNNKIFVSERLCNEIQASRLPDPSEPVWEDFSKDEASLGEDPVNKALEMLDVKACTDVGQTELSLLWDIVKYDKRNNADTSKTMETLAIDGEYKITLQTVEMVEKYTSADIHDWKDPMISVLQEHGLAKVNAVMEEKKKANKPVSNNITKEACKSNVAAPTFEGDPLADFMALRMNMMKSSGQQPAVTGQQDSKVSEVATEEAIRPAVKESRPAMQGKKKTKHHIVSVKLSDDFRKILDLLSDKASYMIEALKASGDVSQSFNFEILTPDMTRFLLKQREKQIQDENLDETSDDTYRKIVGLHALSGAADIIANCCLESGIAHISAVQEKYSSVLKALAALRPEGLCIFYAIVDLTHDAGGLEDIRKIRSNKPKIQELFNYGLLTNIRENLFELRAVFYKRQIHHPKVVALCKEVETWLKKKRAKSGDHEQKILVLIRRNIPSLLTYLKNVLGLGRLLVPEVLTSNCSENIIKSLDEHNCLIAYAGLVDDNFPWAQFCLVVEYEYQSDSVWKDHCERQKIRHIAIKVDKVDKQELFLDIDWTSHRSDTKITLIASQNVTRNVDMLQMLEARHNIMLLERDYSLLEGCQHLHFPDIDVDEGCGIVLLPLVELKDDCMMQAFITKVLALSLKLKTCWILLYSDKPNCYEFPGIVVSNMTKLEAAIANISSKSEELEIKTIICSDLAEVAGNIRRICEHCMTANDDRQMDDWLSRAWLTEDTSQEEKFLLMMPPITSFSAQLMLKKVTMKELFNSNLDELSARLPWVPVKVLKLLLRTASKVHGLHLQDDIQVAQTEHEDSSLSVNGEFEIEYSDNEERNDSSEHSCQMEETVSSRDEDVLSNRVSEAQRDSDSLLTARKMMPLSHDESCYSRNGRDTVCELVKVEITKKHSSIEELPVVVTQRGSDEVKKTVYESDSGLYRDKSLSVQQINRNTTFNEVLRRKAHKQDWLMLENFIDSKKGPDSHSFQSCTNDEIQKENNPPRSVDRTKVSGTVLQKKDKRAQQSADRCLKVIQKEDETLGNKHSIVCEQDEPLHYNPPFYSNKNYTPVQRGDQEIYFKDMLEKRKNFKESLFIDKDDDIICRSKDVDTKCNDQMDTFLPSEIEQLVNEDLENFIVGKRIINRENTGSYTEHVDADWVRYPERPIDNVLNGELKAVKHYQHDTELERIENNPAGELRFLNADSYQNTAYRYAEAVPDWQNKISQSVEDRLQDCSSDYSVSTLLSFNSNSNLERIRADPEKMKSVASFSGDPDERSENKKSVFWRNENNILNTSKTNELAKFDAKWNNFKQDVKENDTIAHNDMLRREEFSPRLDLSQNQFKYQLDKYNFDHDQSWPVRNTGLAEADFRQQLNKSTSPIQHYNKEENIRFNLDFDRENYAPDDIKFDRKGVCIPNRQNNIELKKQVPFSFEQGTVNNRNNFDNNQSGYLYINPEAERLSHPPQFMNVQLHKSLNGIRTLEEDLRETTRKFLANSQQFSRFNSNSSRRPLQKLNIGLATPLHRDKISGSKKSGQSNNTSPWSEYTALSQPNMDPRSSLYSENTDQLPKSKGQPRKVPRAKTNTDRVPDSGLTEKEISIPESRRRLDKSAAFDQKALILQSPWATEDSPPMDLDFDDEISNTDTTNRAVFTSQTPQKKRKLTYQAVPGKKGQTRLVFQ